MVDIQLKLELRKRLRGQTLFFECYVGQRGSTDQTVR